MTPKQLSLFDPQPDDSGDFFNRKRDWSTSKHRILLRYIQSFCYNLGGNKPFQSNSMNYVDGFAGTGKYDAGIGIKDFVDNSNFWASKYKHEFEDTDGSPSIALKCSHLFRQEKRVNLRCFLIEHDLKNNERLKINCQAIQNSGFYKVYDPKPFESALPELLEDLKNYPTLFFLDAFGVKGITFKTIRTIGDYVKRNKGEMFLLFHNRSVARSAGQSTLKSKDPKAIKAAKAYCQNLTELLGTNSDRHWKQKWLELKETPQSFEKWALEYFKNRMRLESGFKGVTSFEIKETFQECRPQYSVVVGSNHPDKAFGEFLNEFVYEEEKLLFFKENTTQEVQFFLEKEWEAETRKRIREITPKALEILSDRRSEWLSFKQAITKIILNLNEIGRLKRTQYYNEVLGTLYQQGRLEIKNLGSKKPYTLNSLLRLR